MHVEDFYADRTCLLIAFLHQQSRNKKQFKTHRKKTAKHKEELFELILSVKRKVSSLSVSRCASLKLDIAKKTKKSIYLPCLE